MMHNLSLALQITVVGMSLVFAAIILLWIVMAVLVRITAEKETAGDDTDASLVEQETRQAELALKQRAAAAAVAAAMAQDTSNTPNVIPLPEPAMVTAWQAVRRSQNLNRRGSVR